MFHISQHNFPTAVYHLWLRGMQQNFFHIGQYLTLLMLVPNLLSQNCAWKGTLRLPPVPPTPVFCTYTALTLIVLTWVAHKLYSDGEAACSLNCPRGTIYIPRVLSANYFPSMEKMFFHCYCQNLLLSSMKCSGINQTINLGKTTYLEYMPQSYPKANLCSFNALQPHVARCNSLGRLLFFPLLKTWILVTSQVHLEP